MSGGGNQEKEEVRLLHPYLKKVKCAESREVWPEYENSWEIVFIIWSSLHL